LFLCEEAVVSLARDLNAYADHARAHYDIRDVSWCINDACRHFNNYFGIGLRATNALVVL
jgi:hypothetical protein